MIVFDLLMSPSAPMKYLLTYKLSQDHIELFFGAVRSSGGFNNNPTSLQFMSAYRRLLMRHEIEGGKGNCIALDKTKILDKSEDLTRCVDIDRRHETEDHPVEEVPIHLAPDFYSLSEYNEAAIS